jgi:hypothetical protein
MIMAETNRQIIDAERQNNDAIEKEIESLTRVVNNIPVRLGGRLLMKIAKLKRQLQ